MFSSTVDTHETHSLYKSKVPYEEDDDIGAEEGYKFIELDRLISLQTPVGHIGCILDFW